MKRGLVNDSLAKNFLIVLKWTVGYHLCLIGTGKATIWLPVVSMQRRVTRISKSFPLQFIVNTIDTPPWCGPEIRRRFMTYNDRPGVVQFTIWKSDSAGIKIRHHHTQRHQSLLLASARHKDRCFTTAIHTIATAQLRYLSTIRDRATDEGANSVKQTVCSIGSFRKSSYLVKR